MSRRAIVLSGFLGVILVILALAACDKATVTEYNIDNLSCSGCGDCVRVCPNDAIYLDINGKARIDQSKCTRCGKCVTACPNSAVY